MGIKVEQLFDYTEFDKAQLIVGENGLSKEIKRINLLGISTKELNDMNDIDISDLIKAGDFYIALSSFFENADVNSVMEFQSLINQNSSGVCIIGYKENLLSDEIKVLCNQYDYPIIGLDGSVPFPNLIDVMMNALINARIDNQVDQIIRRIYFGEHSKEQIKEYLLEINHELEENILVVYMTSPGKKLKNLIRERLLSGDGKVSIMNLGEGVIILLTSRTDNKKYNMNELESIRNGAGRFLESFKMGVSGSYNGLGEFNVALDEAIFAHSYALENNQTTTMFNELEISNWLYELRDSIEMKKYSESILLPIKEYEKKHDIKLMSTLECFTDYEGNYKKIAEALYIHENSVRYRMDKIKEAVGNKEDKVSLYTKFNIAIKYNRMIEIIKEIERRMNKEGD